MNYMRPVLILILFLGSSYVNGVELAPKLGDGASIVLQDAHAHTTNEIDVVVSPDGNYWLTYDRVSMCLWNAKTKVILFNYDIGISRALFAPDCRRLITLERLSDNALKVWEIPSGKLLKTIKAWGGIHDACLCWSGNNVVSNGNANVQTQVVDYSRAIVFDVTTGEIVKKLVSTTGDRYQFVPVSKNNLIAGCNASSNFVHAVEIIDPSSAAVKHTCERKHKTDASEAFQTNFKLFSDYRGDLIVEIRTFGNTELVTITAWDSSTGKEIGWTSLSQEEFGYRDLDRSILPLSSTEILIGGRRGFYRWTIAGIEKPRYHNIDMEGCRLHAVLADGSILLGKDERVISLNLDTKLETDMGLRSRLNSEAAKLTISSNGRCFAGADFDIGVYLWDLLEARPIGYATCGTHTEPYLAENNLSIAEDLSALNVVRSVSSQSAVRDTEFIVERWDLKSGSRTRPFQNLKHWGDDVPCFGLNERFFTFASGRFYRRFDLFRGVELESFGPISSGFSTRCSLATRSPYLFSIEYNDKAISRVFNLESGASVYNGEGFVSGLMTPDLNWLITASGSAIDIRTAFKSPILKSLSGFLALVPVSSNTGVLAVNSDDIALIKIPEASKLPSLTEKGKKEFNKLLNRLDDDNYDVRAEASLNLQRFGPEALGEIKTLLSTTNQNPTELHDIFAGLKEKWLQSQVDEFKIQSTVPFSRLFEIGDFNRTYIYGTGPGSILHYAMHFCPGIKHF
jgi:WD40 repeat protein